MKRLYWKGKPINELPIETLLEIIEFLAKRNAELQNPVIDLAKRNRRK